VPSIVAAFSVVTAAGVDTGAGAAPNVTVGGVAGLPPFAGVEDVAAWFGAGVVAGG
jgi:hypothetical protein